MQNSFVTFQHEIQGERTQGLKIQHMPGLHRECQDNQGHMRDPVNRSKTRELLNVGLKSLLASLRPSLNIESSHESSQLPSKETSKRGLGLAQW